MNLEDYREKIFMQCKKNTLDKSCQNGTVSLQCKNKYNKLKHKAMNSYNILFGSEIAAFINETIDEAQKIEISILREERPVAI